MVSALACWALACALGALAGTTLHAQRPAPTLAQRAHRAWTIRDGAPGAVNALAQTPDGFLWLGTGMGLYRFDGVRFEEFEPSVGQALPSRVINALFALPDGALWIGYTHGGASVLAGRHIASYAERDGLPTGTVTAFARDSSGTIWAATTSGLARLVGDRWTSVGPESGFPGGAVADLLVDRRGTLWAAAISGVYIRPRGARHFVRRALSLTARATDAGSGAIREAPDGSVWAASVTLGLMPLSDSAGGAPPAGNGGNVEPDWRGMFIDREGSAWRLGQTGKLVRMPLTAARGAAGRRAARAARESLSFSPVVGMSGSAATAGLEDREGTVWLGTQGGLDQFRATKLTPVVLPRGMTDPVIVAGDTGAAWAWGHPGPLVAIGDGVVEHSEVSGRITAMSRDLEGGVWVGGFDGLWYKGPRTHAGTFTPVTLPPEGSGSLIQAIARDRDGTLWLSVLFRGVFRRRAHVWEHYVPRQDFRRDAYAGAIHADHAGRTWLGYKGDRLALVTAKGARVFSAADGLRVGPVTAIHARGARVWVGGETGVVYLDDVRDGARFVPLAVANGALHSVSGIVETADGDLWLNSDEGVTRVPAAELRHAQRDPGYRARADRFGIRDGLEGAAVHIRPLGTAVEGTDGRLWFTTQTSIAWLDPRQIRRNLLPPPVQIRTLEADGTQYTTSDRVTLPRRTTALSVAYTALSLAVPERVRFRYRLVGVDTAWQDAGARREAFYTNLRPGAYRFQVIAANDDGVWNTTGAALEFVIPPTFVQTNAFFLLCIAGSATTLWLLVQWRQRRATAAMRARFDATFAERLRVARELHDTLLSGVAGLAMRLDAVAMRARSSSSVDVAALDQLREQARLTLTEAREAVVGMRASGDALVPLSARLANAARRVFAETDVDVRLVVTGPQRRHGQALEEEVLRIAMEAMTNARDHAHGRTVTVTCAYGERELCVRVRDDGRGFDPARAMANGHFGMAGMRERAASIGARLTVTSAPGRGTDVLLVVGPLQRVMSADAAW